MEKKLTDQIQKLEKKTTDTNKKQEEKLSNQILKLEEKTDSYNQKQEERLNEQDNGLNKKITEEINKIEQQSKTGDKQIEDILNQQIQNVNKKFEEVTIDFNKKLNENYNTLDKKLTDSFKKFGQAVDERFKSFEEKFNERVGVIEQKINAIIEKMKEMSEDLSDKMQNIKEEFETKDLVLRDIEQKHNEENLNFQNQLKPVLENLKSQQDLAKITMDVMKKQIYESAKGWITAEMNKATKNKEREILMNVWIDEIREIISDVDKLKNMNPKELKLQLNEISSTIESFKQKYTE